MLSPKDMTTTIHITIVVTKLREIFLGKEKKDNQTESPTYLMKFGLPANL